MNSSLKQNNKFYKPIVFRNIFANYKIDCNQFPILTKGQGDDISTVFDIKQRFRADNKINKALLE